MISMIARAFALSLGVTPLLAPGAAALPFTVPISGGPSSSGDQSIVLIDESPVFWVGPFSPAGYASLRVTGFVTLTGRTSLTSATTDTFRTGIIRYAAGILEGDGVFGGPGPILGAVPGPLIDVTPGQVVNVVVEKTIPLDFTLIRSSRWRFSRRASTMKPTT